MVSDILIVFTPKHTSYRYKRFLVSARQLHKYIGKDNANKAIERANSLRTNKCTLKFRKFGKLDIYLK